MASVKKHYTGMGVGVGGWRWGMSSIRRTHGKSWEWNTFAISMPVRWEVETAELLKLTGQLAKSIL